MDSDGNNTIGLTDDSAMDSNLQWSPDGERIMFTSNRTGDWNIYVLYLEKDSLVNLNLSPGDDLKLD